MTSSREGQISKRDGSRIVGEARRRQDGEDASSIESTLIYWQRLPGAPRKDYGLWRQDRFTRLVGGWGGEATAVAPAPCIYHPRCRRLRRRCAKEWQGKHFGKKRPTGASVAGKSWRIRAE